MSEAKVVWLSANVFGYEVLGYIVQALPRLVTHIITLSEGGNTKMYDGVETRRWSWFGLPVHYANDSYGVEKLVAELNPDLLVMIGWRQMLTDTTLALAKLGTVGFHPTLLPKGRGPAPIINSIMAGWTEGGLTMFYPNDRVDAGDIIAQRPFPIGDNDHAWDYYQKVIQAGCGLCEEFLPKILAGTAPRLKQDESRANYFQSRKLADNEILPSDSVEIAHRKIRAFSHPYNGAFIRKGDKKLIIWRSELIDERT